MNPASSSSGRAGQHAVTPPQGKPERKGHTPDGPSALPRPQPSAEPADGKPQRRLTDKVLRDTKHRPSTRRERMQMLQALSSSTILALAHRAGLAKPMLRDLTAFEKLVGEINRLGESLTGEVPANLAESITERVIKVIAASTAVNTGVLTYPLTDLLGGQAMSAQRVEGLVRQLLFAQERVASEALLMSLRGVFGVLGGSHLSRPHRQAAVTAGLAVIDAAQDHDRVYVAGALLNAITHADEPQPQPQPPAMLAGGHASTPMLPAATTAHVQCHDDPAALAHLQGLVNDIVSPDLPGSLEARQAMLRALAFLVHAHQDPAEAGPAYIDLLASAPSFSGPLYSSVARGLPMELLLGNDDPQSAQALERLTAYARRLVTWAAQLDAAQAQALGEGFYEQLWIDVALSRAQFGAALLVTVCATSTPGSRCSHRCSSNWPPHSCRPRPNSSPAVLSRPRTSASATPAPWTPCSRCWRSRASTLTSAAPSSHARSLSRWACTTRADPMGRRWTSASRPPASPRRGWTR